MKMERVRPLVLAASLVIAALAGLAGSRIAWASAPVATQLQASASSATANGLLQLQVTLQTAAGVAIGNRQVSFYERADFFGRRQVLLGTAMTDSTGAAVFAYRPAQAGNLQFEARFAGDSAYSGSQAGFTAQLAAVPAPVPPPAGPLSAVARPLVWSVAILLLAFWTVLLGIFLRAAHGIRAVGITGESPAAVVGRYTEPAMTGIQQEGIHGH